MDKLTKKQFQDLADSVGMPDEEDKQMIQRIILSYERKHPGEIKFHRDAAREHMGTSTGNDFAEMAKITGEKNSARRYMMELPTGLHEKLEAYIPSIFTSKKHFGWFCKNFPELMIGKRF